MCMLDGLNPLETDAKTTYEKRWVRPVVQRVSISFNCLIFKCKFLAQKSEHFENNGARKLFGIYIRDVVASAFQTRRMCVRRAHELLKTLTFWLETCKCVCVPFPGTLCVWRWELVVRLGFSGLECEGLCEQSCLIYYHYILVCGMFIWPMAALNFIHFVHFYRLAIFILNWFMSPPQLDSICSLYIIQIIHIVQRPPPQPRRREILVSFNWPRRSRPCRTLSLTTSTFLRARI